ncbi:MAG: hypothetical protein CMJ48_08195 [Planctomycetaceae bacterium]|nr:hypothetical protein [Planctomycetaceae bacterium]
MYEFLTWLLQPFVVCLLLSLAGLANLWRKRVETKRRLLLAAAPFALLILVSIPVVSWGSAAILETAHPRLDRRPDDAQAIVILGGYLSEPDETRPSPQLGIDSLRRCIRGVELYRDGEPVPVLLTGRIADATPGELSVARVMGNLVRQLGVAEQDVIVEEVSRSTWENAVESARLLKERGMTRIVLVTDGKHLLRAVRCFEKQGLDVVPAAAGYQAGDFEWTLDAFQPDASAAMGTDAAFHEFLGLLWYWSQGRI